MKASFFQIGSRVFRNVGTSLWRNRLTVFFSSIALALVFLLVHLSMLIGLFVDDFLQNLEKKVDIPVMIQNEASDFHVESFRLELEKKKESGEFLDFWELSKDDALKVFEEKFPDKTQFLERYNLENPLSTVFGIVPNLKKTSYEEIQVWLLSDEFREIIDQKHIQNMSNLRDRFDLFIDASQVTHYATYFFRLFFYLIAFVLVFHVVSLMIHSRSREISIMRLVGARLSFIRSPFILEGGVLFLFGFLISAFLFWGVLSVFQSGISSLLIDVSGDSTLLPFFTDENITSFVLLKNGLFLLLFSLIAGFFAVEKVLRKKVISEF